MGNKKLKLINSFSISASVTVIFIVIITIVSELVRPVKDWLAGTFSHHWVGKGILSLILFLVLGFILFWVIRTSNEEKAGRNFRVLFWIGVISFLAIFAFYIFEFFV